MYSGILCREGSDRRIIGQAETAEGVKELLKARPDYVNMDERFKDKRAYNIIEIPCSLTTSIACHDILKIIEEPPATREKKDPRRLIFPLFRAINDNELEKFSILAEELIEGLADIVCGFDDFSVQVITCILLNGDIRYFDIIKDKLNFSFAISANTELIISMIEGHISDELTAAMAIYHLKTAEIKTPRFSGNMEKFVEAAVYAKNTGFLYAVGEYSEPSVTMVYALLKAGEYDMIDALTQDGKRCKGLFRQILTAVGLPDIKELMAFFGRRYMGAENEPEKVYFSECLKGFPESILFQDMGTMYENMKCMRFISGLGYRTSDMDSFFEMIYSCRHPFANDSISDEWKEILPQLFLKECRISYRLFNNNVIYHPELFEKLAEAVGCQIILTVDDMDRWDDPNSIRESPDMPCDAKRFAVSVRNIVKNRGIKVVFTDTVNVPDKESPLRKAFAELLKLAENADEQALLRFAETASADMDMKLLDIIRKKMKECEKC